MKARHAAKTHSNVIVKTNSSIKNSKADNYNGNVFFYVVCIIICAFLRVMTAYASMLRSVHLVAAWNENIYNEMKNELERNKIYVIYNVAVKAYAAYLSKRTEGENEMKYQSNYLIKLNK